MKKNKIFIQIASYRDPQLIPTIKDCIANAKYPKNLVFGITWQHSTEDEWDDLSEFKNDKRFRIIDVDYKDSQGACWARNLLQQQYNNEEYTFQLDSHHRFIKNWDEELINMYKQLKEKGVKKPLLTGYITSFDPENDSPEKRSYIPWKMNFDRFTPEGVVFFLPTNIENYKELTEPIPSRFYSAHFAFTSGNFVKEVPHDPEYYFHGEEISIAVRAYTWGYDLYHPHKVIAWHEYTRKGRTKHWDDNSEWNKRNLACHKKNRQLFGMDGEVKPQEGFGIYDFGNVRTLHDYEKYAGISFSKRAVTQHTLDNKLPPNPEMSDEEFENSLSKVFKHCIDIRPNQFKYQDHDFWLVAFKDKNGNTLYRKDADIHEIERIKKDPDGYYKIWRTFDAAESPAKWMVMEHSKEHGWGKTIEGNLITGVVVTNENDRTIKDYYIKINLLKEQFKHDDHDFWVVAFENSEGKTIYRRDANEQEIKEIKNNYEKNQNYEIIRSFSLINKPVKWVVWEHSKEHGWAERIENMIYL